MLGKDDKAAAALDKSYDIDKHAANGCAVAANPLGGRFNHNVGAVIYGAAQIAAGTEGVVDDQRQAVLFGQRGKAFKVGNVKGRVADAFGVNAARLVIDLLFKGGRVIVLDNAHLDAQARQGHLELVPGAAVQ